MKIVPGDQIISLGLQIQIVRNISLNADTCLQVYVYVYLYVSLWRCTQQCLEIVFNMAQNNRNTNMNQLIFTGLTKHP